MTLSREEVRINFDRSIRLVLLAFLILWSAAASADEELVNSYKSTITAELIGNLHIGLDDNLLASGLAKIDIDRIVEKLAVDVASCVADAVINIADANGVAIETVLGDPKYGKLETLGLDEAEFREIAKPCFYTAFENAGIAEPFDTN